VLDSLRAARGEIHARVFRIHQLDGQAARAAQGHPVGEDREGWLIRKAHKEAKARRALLDDRTDRTIVVIRREENDRLVSELWYRMSGFIKGAYDPLRDDFTSELEDLLLATLGEAVDLAADRPKQVWAALGLPDLDNGPPPAMGAVVNGFRLCVLDFAALDRDFRAMVRVLHENGVKAEPELPLLRLNAAPKSKSPARAAFTRWCSSMPLLERLEAVELKRARRA